MRVLPTRRLATTVAVLAVALWWLGPGALPALAHTGLVESSPSDAATVDRLPATLTLTFSDDLVAAPGATRVEVRDSAGTSLAVAEPAVAGRSITQALAGSATGPVGVRWRVVAGDGHPVTGEFSFTVTGAVPSPAPLGPASAAPPPGPAPGPATPPASAPQDAGRTGPVGGWLPWLMAAALALALAVGALTGRARRRP